MKSLICELNKSNLITQAINTDNVKNYKVYSDSIYEMYFDANYEKKFTKYEDIDKCHNGFRGRHPPFKKTRVKKMEVCAKINSIKDLIKLTYNYPLSQHIAYDINIGGIHKIRDELLELDAFIGLDTLKENLIDQLIYFMYENGDDYLHTVLYGPPGTGENGNSENIRQYLY